MTDSGQLLKNERQGRTMQVLDQAEAKCGADSNRRPRDRWWSGGSCSASEPEDRAMRDDDTTDRQLGRQQVLKYAEDLARIYQEEKTRRQSLEKVNKELNREIRARREAERAVRLAHRDLEKRVRERTEELRQANERLEKEVAQRKIAEAQIRKQLQEKEVLLHEVHHRVKNNLQMICSLLSLQSSSTKDPKLLAALSDSECRVRSMALIHEQLYRSKSLARIHMKYYLEALVRSLTQTCENQALTLSAFTDVDDEHLTVDTALPCGLIINELVTNCVKHAFFQGASGEIRVAFKKKPAGGYMLEVRDNGKGILSDFNWRASPSLGFRLVRQLAEYQLRGKISVRSESGTVVTIDLPNLK